MNELFKLGRITEETMGGSGTTYLDLQGSCSVNSHQIGGCPR